MGLLDLFKSAFDWVVDRFTGSTRDDDDTSRDRYDDEETEIDETEIDEIEIDGTEVDDTEIDEFDTDETESDEFDSDEFDSGEDEEDDDYDFPDNVIYEYSDVAPNTDTITYRSVFYFASDVTEYVKDIPVLVKVVEFDGTFFVYVIGSD